MRKAQSKTRFGSATKIGVVCSRFGRKQATLYGRF
jgi:hypothetical protein